MLSLQWVHMAWNGYAIENTSEASNQLLVDITNEVVHGIDACRWNDSS